MRATQWMTAVLVTTALILPRWAAAEATSETAPQKFGAPVTVKKATSVAKVQKNPSKLVGKTVRIEGVVKEVCQGMGCWVEVEGPDGATFIARSLDESVLLPKDCAGSQIVVQGVMTSMAAKGHVHADHEKMEAEHSCPAPNYLLSTQGIELIAKR